MEKHKEKYGLFNKEMAGCLKPDIKKGATSPKKGQSLKGAIDTSR